MSQSVFVDRVGVWREGGKKEEKQEAIGIYFIGVAVILFLPKVLLVSSLPRRLFVCLLSPQIISASMDGWIDEMNKWHYTLPVVPPPMQCCAGR